MTEQKAVPKQKIRREIPPWLITQVALLVFVVNVITYVILTDLVYLPKWIEAIMDSLVLVVTLTPSLYFLFLKPSYKLTADLQKFERAIENASEHIIITDLDGKIMYANPAAELITGYSKDEMIGKRPSLWGGQMDKEFYDKMWHTIKDDRNTFLGEIRNKRKNGELYAARVNISPILNKKGNVEFFVGIEHDVTKERELAQAQNDFIAIASHQLRTPLTSIWWVSDLFLKKEKLTDKGKEYLNDIRSAAMDLNALVNLLLNASRIETGKVAVSPKPMDFIVLIKKIIEENRPFIDGKKIQMVFADHPEKLDIVSDETVLGLVIKSLLSNAIEYTPQEGKVEISVKLEEKGDSFLLTIGDTGIGIPQTEQKNIFKKLFRASNARLVKPGGTGLGLYVANEASRLLGDRMWFESAENKGTTFFIELPIKSEPKEGTRKFLG